MFLNIDRHDKSAIAMIDNEENRISYGEVVREIAYIGSKVVPRAVIFILCKNTVGSVLGYLAFAEYRAVSLPLNRGIDRALLADLFHTYAPAYLWVPDEDVEKFTKEYNTTAEISVFGYTLLKTQNPLYPIDDHLEFLMTTSGSTGSPKLVRYKRGNLEANAKNVAAAFGWTKDERAICDLGMQYTMGLNVMNTHLYVGATLLLTTYNLMSGEFWEYIKKEKGTNFTGVPFSYDILERLRFRSMDLPDLRTLSQGGGRLTDVRFQQLAQYARATGKRFIASFGTTETSARMACLPAELAEEKTGSIGFAIPEGRLFLINEKGEEITEAEADGELCYSGPNVTMGYATSKKELLEKDQFNGTYHTGDLAHRDKDGCYFITGRMSRFLKLLSYRVGLDECENLIRQEFGIDCACSGTDQNMNIYITDASKEMPILDFISSKTGLYKSLFKIYTIQEITRNDAGKIQYRLLDQMYGK